MPRRTSLVLVLALIAGSLAASIAHREISRFSSDSFHYMLLGDALAHGRGFVSGGSQHPDLTRSPLLPLLIAPLVWVLGDPVRAGIAVITLAAAALAVPLFFLCRDLFGPRAAYAALPLAAVSCAVGTADRVLPTPLHLLGFATTAALLVRSLKRGRPFDAFWVGIAGGLTALARPEGLPYLALPLSWTLLGPSPFAEGAPVRRPARVRLASFAWILAGAALCLVPYVAWTSARLHRFAPMPAFQYVNDTRYVTDRFGLRDVKPYIPWEERALFLVTEEGSERVLDLYFRTRRMPDAHAPQTLPEAATAGPEHPALLRQRVARALFIGARNLRLVPSHLGQAHLLPPVPLLLGIAGLLACLTRRGGWRPLAFACALMAFGLLPIVTNMEDRFLYAPFAAGLVVAAAGWGAIDARAAARLPGLARIALHAALLWGVAASGLTHRMNESPNLDIEEAQRALARRAEPSLAPGPILAVRPHFPFWAGRPYRPLPILAPDAALAFARRQGAAALFFQIPYDLKNRPLLAGLTGPDPPPGFTLLDTEPVAGGGELRLFRLGLSGQQDAGEGAMILVLGSTGTVGSALVRELAAHDAPFRVLVRTLGRMPFPPKTQIVTGDLADPGSLAAAFHGVERLFVLTPPVDSMVALQKAALAAARHAGVRQVVKLSIVGVGEDAPTHLGRWHSETDAEVRSFPSWTILCPHSFMQNTLAFAPAIRAEGRFYAPTGGGTFPLVDARDVAAVAAECLTSDDHAGETYVLTGPEAIGYDRVAHEIGDAIGRPVRFVDVPAEAGRQGMRAAGYPAWLAEDLVTMMDTWRQGTDCDLSHAVRSVAGLVPRSYRTFAQEHKEAWK